MPKAVHTPLLEKVWKYDADGYVPTVTQSAKDEIGRMAKRTRNMQIKENMRLGFVIVIFNTSDFLTLFA